MLTHQRDVARNYGESAYPSTVRASALLLWSEIRRNRLNRRGRLNRFYRFGPWCFALRNDGIIVSRVVVQHRDALIHLRSLLLERTRGGSILLDQRRVLLRSLVHLRERLADLIDAGGLFGGGRGDARDNIG